MVDVTTQPTTTSPPSPPKLGGGREESELGGDGGGGLYDEEVEEEVPIVTSDNPNAKGLEIVSGRFKNVNPSQTKSIIRRVDRQLGSISNPLVGVQIDDKKELSVPNRVGTVPEPPLATTVRALPALTGRKPTIYTHVTDADRNFLKHQKDLLELQARDRYAVETLANGSKEWVADHCPGVLDRAAETMDKISDCRRFYDKLKMNGVNSAEDVAFMMKWDEYKSKFPNSFLDAQSMYPKLPYKDYKHKDSVDGFERGFYNMNRRMNREFNKWWAESTLTRAVSGDDREEADLPTPKFGPRNDFRNERERIIEDRMQFEGGKKEFKDAFGVRRADRVEGNIGLGTQLQDWVGNWFGYGAATPGDEKGPNPYVNMHRHR